MVLSKYDKFTKYLENPLPSSNGELQDALKLELDAINVQYNQCFHELLRMRDEAVENAKKKWIAKKKIPVI